VADGEPADFDLQPLDGAPQIGGAFGGVAGLLHHAEQALDGFLDDRGGED
jgi:hypothetical protein